jgi:hypothetical protein
LKIFSFDLVCTLLLAKQRKRASGGTKEEEIVWQKEDREELQYG